MIVGIDEIIRSARQNNASDVHLVKGLPPRYRIDGDLKNFGEPLSAEACENYARTIAGDKYEKFAKTGELDLAATFSEIRCRVNIFRQQGFVSTAIRLLADKIPDLEDLGLPPMVKSLPQLNRGIVLVTGEAGSGKSTTLAAILERINHNYDGHIITLEDPIEYVYTPDRCIINQREIGIDTKSYSTGLRSSLREDPNVILIGEMRDLDTIETALTAAETGHLVFTTLHTGSAVDSIDRIVDVFPEGKQKQIRLQLSTTLMAVLSQRLVKRTTGGRVAACELMMVTPAIRNLIREGRTPQIQGGLSTYGAEGSVTMDNWLIGLYKQNVISLETAKAAARDIEYIKKNIGR